ncbi:TPA: hypothetical protein MEB24_001644 [Klebsiella aerogenes]|uniref:helix-turn-helix domain-containing protein n=1 Tax=Klebsiella aerogenes TaxID=548 RepID=UPI000B415B60|nr:helix-turn-helix domain-containing protein [Klebsiella aerogenes]PVF75157.1 hypothetical protein CSC18_1058 [Klebsiella aerogenes]RNT22736.1 hypothetical protein B9031_023185 [Klebsiella aerogenes]HBQ1170801.1 helix-turn-helix domain-containing protein [Klebsiella aerogenes]HBW0109575.1 hypothetical protein [Klebsiella aerogenes]
MSRIQTPYSHIIDEYNKMISKNIKAIDSLSHSSNIRQIADDTSFTLSTGEIIIVLEGVIAVEMQEHNFILAPGKAKTQAKKLFQIGKGIKGMFFGIVESYGPGIQLHYTAKKNVKVFSCNLEYFEKHFTQPDKFTFLMNMMAITLAFLLDAHDERAIGTRYFVIRSMIYRYLKQKNEGVLHDPSLANFILRRTKMSRSYLFQVLSDLKNGGYITMKNGELVDIVNELPEKY